MSAFRLGKNGTVQKTLRARQDFSLKTGVYYLIR